MEFVRAHAGTGRPIAALSVRAPRPADPTPTSPGFATFKDLAERAPQLSGRLDVPPPPVDDDPAGHTIDQDTDRDTDREDDAPDTPEERPGRRLSGVVLAAATALVVAVATVATAVALNGDDEPGSTPAASGELGPAAEIAVPGTAPDGADNSGEPVSYAAANLVDGDPSSTWRAKGSAEGETIELTWPEDVTITEVGLVNGYAKVDDVGGDDRYRQNRRILEAIWVFDDGTEVTQEFEGSTDLQAVTLDTPVTTSRVELRLVRVSKPGGRDFTAISELSIVGR